MPRGIIRSHLSRGIRRGEPVALSDSPTWGAGYKPHHEGETFMKILQARKPANQAKLRAECQHIAGDAAGNFTHAEQQLLRSFVVWSDFFWNPALRADVVMRYSAVRNQGAA